jgi:hypothetical protein
MELVSIWSVHWLRLLPSVAGVQQSETENIFRKVSGIPETRNQVELRRLRTTPSVAASANAGADLVTLSTSASKDDALNRPLVDEEADHPFIRKLETRSEPRR